MFDKSHLSRVHEGIKPRKPVVRPKSAGSGNHSRVVSPHEQDESKPVAETAVGNVSEQLQIDVQSHEEIPMHVTVDLSKHGLVKSTISPPRSPLHMRPATQPSGGIRKTLPVATSSRLTKPPVPLLSSRSRRSPASVEIAAPMTIEPIVEKTERNESFETPDCPSPVMGQYHPYQTPYHPYPGQYHPCVGGYPPYMMPYQMPHDMPPQMMHHPQLPMPPGYYHPVIYPGTTLYGNIQQNDQSSATVVYTSGPIPPNTTSIIIVPMQQNRSSCVGTPVSQSVRMNGSISSENSGFSNYGPDQPLVVFIERNIFKHWFDANMPNVLGDLPRIKRFKSTETFMHWLTSKKKYLEMKLIVLVRVTEVSKLISELNKEFPQSVMNGRILKNVFAYEHLFSVPDQPVGKSSLKAVGEEIVRNNRFSVSHCLEDACKLALESLTANELPPTT